MMFAHFYCYECGRDHAPINCPHKPISVKEFSMADFTHTVRVKANPGQANLLQALVDVFERCLQICLDKNYQYKESWKRRGGQGAYFTVARPMDRFHSIAEAGASFAKTGSVDVKLGPDNDFPAPTKSVPYINFKEAPPYDIFGIIEAEDMAGKMYHDGTLSACTQDIFVYMMLIMSEMLLRKRVSNYQSSREPIPVDAGGNPVGRHPQQFEVQQLAKDPAETIATLQARINGLEEQVQNANAIISKQREQLGDTGRLENLREQFAKVCDKLKKIERVLAND